VSEAAALSSSQPDTALPSSSAESQTTTCPAVARCVDAYNRAYKMERSAGREDYAATKIAGKVLRRALPPLVGHENIRDFIACVAQSILLGAIDTNDASKLLYAAQVALAAVRVPPTALDKPRPA
jgi:hypothetical protein